MARTVKPLTELEVKRAKPKDKEYSLYDGDGLQLVIKPSGLKSWIYRYKSPVTKKLVKLTLGKYPLITLKMARNTKTEYYLMLREGKDPRRAKEKQSTLLKDILSEYLKKLEKELSENTLKRDRIYINKDILPTLGDMEVAEITRYDVIETLRRLEKRGSLASLNKAMGFLNRFWRYMLSLGLVERNIILDIDRSIFKKHKEQNFPHLTDINKIRELYDTIYLYQDVITRNALLFGMHTFLRAYNIRHLEWSEIDFKTHTISIPAEKMKTRRPHLVPMSVQVEKILREMETINGDKQYVFMTARGKIMSDSTMNKALARLGYKGVQTTHGFRHSASTILHENIHIHGIRSDVIERQMAHVDNSIRGVYNKALYIEERRELMEWWSEFLSR